MSSATSRFLSMRDLTAQGRNEPVYVINTSEKSELAQKGEIVLQIPPLQGNGKPTPITVPQTFLPVDMTAEVSSEALLASADFRRAVNIGLITPVSSEHAQRLDTMPGAREERQRLREQKNMARKVSAARKISDSGADISGPGTEDGGTVIVDGSGNVRKSEAGFDATNVAQAAAEGLAKVDGLDPSFLMWADRLTLEGDVQATNSIRSRGSMNRRQLKHIHGKLTTAQPTTKQAVADRLARLAEAKAKKRVSA